jgi:RNA polymerase sigma-70 factor (ECF subfamily)
LLRYLRYHAGAAAEDLASEVWLAVAGQLHRFDGSPQALRSLVFAIARRRVVDLRRWRARTVAAVPIESVEDPMGAGDTEAEGIAAASAGLDLARLLAGLTPEQADVVSLRVIGELDVAEVAAMLGKSPGAVRVAQFRALQRLRRTADGRKPVTL